MRHDGRAPHDLRPLRVEVGCAPYAEGSALISFGCTRVLCTATVEERLPRWLDGQGRGWVTAEYGMLPRCSPQRIPRDRASGSGRTHEIQRLIGRSLRAVTRLPLLGERQVILDCDVLQADGGTRTAAITGAWIALAQACRRLQERGVLATSPLADQVAAVSVGRVRGDVVLDLDYAEDSTAEVDANLVMTGDGRLVEVQATGESASFTREEMDAMLDLGRRGIERLLELQREALAGA